MTLEKSLFDAVNYHDRVKNQIPGLESLHQMIGILLAESTPKRGHILALGAGGGLELKAMHQANPNWRFAAIDPSADMIALAKVTLNDKFDFVGFTEGYIDDSPDGLFDAATAILVLHFLDPNSRLKTLEGIHRRLHAGAPLIVVHHSFEPSEADKWLHRYADFQINNGADPIQTRAGVLNMKDKLPTLSPDDDEALFHQAGFNNTEQFYSGFSFKGWITYA